MVICDFDLERVAFAPLEANSPLIVHSNAVRTRPIAGELLQPISRWNPQVTQLIGRIDDEQFTERGLLHLRWPTSDTLPVEESTGVFVSEALDHLES